MRRDITPSVLGIGAVTGYGWGRDPLWEGCLGGASAGALHDVGGAPALVAPVVDPGDGRGEGISTFERATTFAAREAVDDAERRGWRRGRLGLVHCTGIGDIRLLGDQYLRANGRRPRPSTFAHLPHTAVPSLLARHLEAEGPAVVVNAACASALFAIDTAGRWMADGDVDDVLVTCTELCAIREIVDGFRNLRVLVDAGEPLAVTRPFQPGSQGFFLGEAATAFVLGRQRGGYVDVLGSAVSHDAYHLTNVDPSGRRIEDTLRRACGSRGGEVAYVHAHGTGTRANDAVEAATVDRLFDPQVGMYSTKPLTGHCMSASAGLQVVLTALAHEHGTIPAPPADVTANPRLQQPGDPKRRGATLCSSLGLGGYNSAALFG